MYTTTYYKPPLPSPHTRVYIHYSLPQTTPPLPSPHTRVYIHYSLLHTTPLLPPRTFVGPPQSLHAVPVERQSTQLGEALQNVEVTKRGHLEESHPVIGRVRLGFGERDAPLVG